MSRKSLILSCISFIVSVTILLTFLSSCVLAKNPFTLGNNFDDHTYIGPFNISNNKIKEAKMKLASDLSELQSKLEVNLIYQDVQFTLPPETIKFDIDMTLAVANSGEENPIIAIVSREGFSTVLEQELPAIHFNEDSIESIAAGIEHELQTGIMPRNVHITDYVGANIIPTVEVASSEYTIDGISPSLTKALHTLDNMIIHSYETFSMMELLTSPEVGPLTDEEMTLLSSIFYTAILQTNFQVDERNISTTIITDIQPGFEAAMNQILGLDFKFTNPNKTEFTIRAAWSADAIHFSIEGLPFYYTYKPSISNIESFEPRTVRQYSAFVNEGQVVVSQEGKEGVEAIVTRTLSVEGQVVGTEDISEDFYAPIHRIEVHPLSKGNASVVENTNSESSDLPENEGTQSDSERGTSTSEGRGFNNSDNSDELETEQSMEGEVTYDKSGLPISGK